MKIGVNGAIDKGVSTEMKTKIAWLMITMDFHVGVQFCCLTLENPAHEGIFWTYERIIVLIAGFWHQDEFVCTARMLGDIFI